MRASQFIIEGLSSIVYHYTSVGSALKILKSGHFSLTSVYGSIEAKYAPKDHPYFLSTTRTRHGGYHSNVVGYAGVLFVLDGRYYSRHHKAAPIDYWQDRDPIKTGTVYLGRKHEAEDRIYSKTSELDIGGVKEIHVLCEEDAGDNVKSYVRQILLEANRLGISSYFYVKSSAWLNLDKRKVASVSVLKGANKPEIQKHIMSWKPKGYMLPWIQLIFGKTIKDLDYDAIKIARNLQYDYDLDREVRKLSNDMDGVRRATAAFEKDRQNLIKIIKYIQQNKLESIKDLAEHVRDKWKNIVDI